MRKISLFLTLLFVTASAQAELVDRLTGVSFPDEISFNAEGKEYNLHATGVSTRKKFFVKVYSVAHYIQDGTQIQSADPFNSVLQDDKAKQLTIKWTYNAKARKIQDGYREAFRNDLSRSEYQQLQNDIQKYIGFMNKNMREGDQTVLRWLPDGQVDVLINGNQVGSIRNRAFAEALWSIWFGPKSVVNRNQLISSMK